MFVSLSEEKRKTKNTMEDDDIGLSDVEYTKMMAKRDWNRMREIHFKVWTVLLHDGSVNRELKGGSCS
jgi:hypothetical protein